MKFAIKAIWQYPPYPRLLLHYLGKLNIQIFCRYSADAEENANKLHFECANFNSSMRVTVWWVNLCIYCLVYLQNIWNYLSIRRHRDVKSLTVSTFSLVRALCCLPLPGRLSTVPVSCNFFNSLLTLRFVQLFSWNSSLNLFAVYPFKYKLFIKFLSSSLNTILIVDKHCSDVCCDVFPVPQIDRKSY